MCRPAVLSAVRGAQRWLEGLDPRDGSGALRTLGLVFCEELARGSRAPLPFEGDPVPLPPPERFITMPRGDMLALLSRASVSGACPVPAPHPWGPVFGHLAMSHAQSNDLSAVAALVRAGARLGLTDPGLDEGLAFAIGQQGANGSFGLVSDELSSAANLDAAEARLRLTVEVLWAAVEALSRPAPVRPASGGASTSLPPCARPV